ELRALGSGQQGSPSVPGSSSGLLKAVVEAYGDGKRSATLGELVDQVVAGALKATPKPKPTLTPKPKPTLTPKPVSPSSSGGGRDTQQTKDQDSPDRYSTSTMDAVPTDWGL